MRDGTSQEPDPRHAKVREMIQAAYEYANGLPAPWDGHTAKVLATFLAANRGWPLEALLRCVRNRFESEGVNLAEDPIRWIPRLCNYARSPLNRFGDPMPGHEARDKGNKALEKWQQDVNARAAAELAKIRNAGNGH